MITSKQIINISEQYLDTKKVRGFDVLVYKNPTYDDYKQLKAHTLRFTADTKKKNVFVWKSELAIHSDIFPVLVQNSEVTWDSLDYCLEGFAEVSGGTAKMTGWDFVARPEKLDKEQIKYLDNIFQFNWSWLDRYLSGASSYIAKKRIELKRN